MELLHPERLIWLVLVPLSALLIWAAERKRRRRLTLVAGSQWRLRRGTTWLKAVLVTVAVLSMVLALAQPRWGFRWLEVKHHGADLVIAFDVSSSMLAQDINPSRLERAKREVSDLLDHAQGDRVGLVAFAGAAFVECPLTGDFGAIRQFISYLEPTLIPVQGSDLGAALNTSLKALFAGGEASGDGRAIILLSDGEDLEGQLAVALKNVKDKGVKVFTVGFGTKEGAPIPLAAGGFLKDRDGNMVVTHGDEAALEHLALDTGGMYARSVPEGGALLHVYQEGIRKAVAQTDQRTSKEKLWDERFVWFVGLALLLLILEMFLSDIPPLPASTRAGAPTGTGTRRGAEIPGKSKPGGIVKAGTTLVNLLALASLIAAKPSLASTATDAAKAYNKGDFSAAAEGFAAAQGAGAVDPALSYNYGVSQYRKGDYEAAAKGFAEAAEHAGGNVDLAQKSLFNLGNAQAQANHLDEAAKTYEKALSLKPGDPDVKDNLDYVKQLKQQQDQKQQNQKQDQKQQDQQKQQQDQKQSQDQKQDQKQQQDQQKQQQDQKQSQDQKQQDQKQSQDQKQQDQQKQQQDQKQSQDQKQQDQQKQSQDQKQPDQRNTAAAPSPSPAADGKAAPSPAPDAKAVPSPAPGATPPPSTTPSQDGDLDKKDQQQPSPESPGAQHTQGDQGELSKTDAETLLRTVDDTVKKHLFDRPKGTAPQRRPDKEW